jgi:hypothetical protein
VTGAEKAGDSRGKEEELKEEQEREEVVIRHRGRQRFWEALLPSTPKSLPATLQSKVHRFELS